jgi:hypothetical protein
MHRRSAHTDGAWRAAAGRGSRQARRRSFANSMSTARPCFMIGTVAFEWRVVIRIRRLGHSSGDIRPLARIDTCATARSKAPKLLLHAGRRLQPTISALQRQLSFRSATTHSYRGVLGGGRFCRWMFAMNRWVPAGKRPRSCRNARAIAHLEQDVQSPCAVRAPRKRPSCPHLRAERGRWLARG